MQSKDPENPQATQRKGWGWEKQQQRQERKGQSQGRRTRAGGAQSCGDPGAREGRRHGGTTSLEVH